MQLTKFKLLSMKNILACIILSHSKLSSFFPSPSTASRFYTFSQEAHKKPQENERNQNKFNCHT